MDRRIFGIETEFGCLVRDPTVGKPDTLVEKVKDHAFYRMGLGVIDLHARDYTFEPARSGGFLLNGGRRRHNLKSGAGFKHVHQRRDPKLGGFRRIVGIQ